MLVKWLPSIVDILIVVLVIVEAHHLPHYEKRIIGGGDELIEQAPWQVALQFKGRYICGGSILSKYVILTAAHCVSIPEPKLYSVRVGATNKLTDGIVVNVTAFKVHEKYTNKDDILEFDVAVLRLKSSLDLGKSNSIMAIPLPNVSPSVGTTARVTGWGMDESNDYATLLRGVAVNIISNKECNRAYSGVIIKEMLCAAAPGKDACQGDSGGPLVVNNKLVGIVSWGFDCANPEFPGVYTNVAAVREWIKQAVRESQHI